MTGAERHLRTKLIAIRGTTLALLGRPALWPHKFEAARFLWNAHIERWNAETDVTVAIGEATCRLRVQDWFALRDVVLSHEYADAISDLPERCAVLDIGANVGLFAAYVFGQRPSASVISVEPSKDSFSILQSNIAANPHLQWSAERAALWPHAGRVRLSTGALSSGRRVASAGGELVSAMRLSTLLTNMPQPDLLKLDIEGAEQDVLADAESLLPTVRRLVVELHPQQCDATAVTRMLCGAFQYVYRLQRTGSSKPLIVAAATPLTAATHLKRIQ